MPYYREQIEKLDSIRSLIKHAPEHLDLERVRSALGGAIRDLAILAELQRPASYKMERQPDQLVKVTIEIVTDEDDAEELVRKLWTELEYPPA